MDRDRASDGFVWGTVATFAMSTLLLAATAAGLSPTPAPIYEAVVTLAVGDLPGKVDMLAGLALHFCYGGVVGGIVAGSLHKVSLPHGLAVGLGLWVVSGLGILPLLDWGVFGLGIGVSLAAGTLVTNLVYGGVFGWLVDREGSTTGTTAW